MENLHKTGGDIYSFKVGKVRLKFISAKIKSPYHNIYILLKQTVWDALKGPYQEGLFNKRLILRLSYKIQL